MQPKVSVIMPTCSRAHFLKRAIDSVFAQTYENIELVVVDDNAMDPESRNATAQVVKEYESLPNFVFVKNEKKLGGGFSRNAGIAACSGDYVAFLDDDDMYLENKIKTQVDFMLMHSLDISLSDLLIYSSSGEFSEHRSRRFIKEWDAVHILKKHMLYNIASTPTLMIKKELINTVGGFKDVKTGQDFVLLWDILNYSIDGGKVNIGYMPCSNIVAFLHSGGRISTGKNKIEGENYIYNLKKTKFSILSKKEIRYIKFRYNAVLCIACLRSRMMKDSFLYLLKAFFTSPSNMFKDGFAIIKKRRLAKKANMPRYPGKGGGV